MEHIRQHDWCSSKPEAHFVTEKDINNCVIEKILRNKFHDPLLSSDSNNSDSEDESQRVKIDWDEVFKKGDNQRKQNCYVPGMHYFPGCPKLSALTAQQHLQILRVLSNLNPNILCTQHTYYKPSRMDFKVYEECKETYENEQKEFQEWARTLWINNHCVRALRPKPTIEMVYEAEFKIKASEMVGFPKRYEMAALIPFDSNQNNCEIVLQKRLIEVNLSTLPNIEHPDMRKKCTIMQPCPVPEPCTRHPVRFILPNEQSMSILPVTEVHRELAQYACTNGAQYIASENALKCLVETDRHWTIPVSVCQAIGEDGEKCNVFVFGNEFSINRESAQTRTYKAFRHLVESAFVSITEKAKMYEKNEKAEKSAKKRTESKTSSQELENDDLSSDDEDNLVIADNLGDTNVPDDEQINLDQPMETNENEKRITRNSIKQDDTHCNDKSNNETTKTNDTQNDDYDSDDSDALEIDLSKTNDYEMDETNLNNDEMDETKFDDDEIDGAKSNDGQIIETNPNNGQINATKSNNGQINGSITNDVATNESKLDDDEINGTKSKNSEINAAKSNKTEIDVAKSVDSDMSMEKINEMDGDTEKNTNYDSDSSVRLVIVAESDENSALEKGDDSTDQEKGQTKTESVLETPGNIVKKNQNKNTDTEQTEKLEPNQKIETSKKITTEISTGKKRKARTSKTQAQVKKVKPHELERDDETDVSLSQKETEDSNKVNEKEDSKTETEGSKNSEENKAYDGGDSFYKCTCEDSIFKKPSPRSFTKYLVKKKNSNEKFDLIVHCSHKYRDQNNEVLLEPVPEYQLDLGASSQSQQKLASMALSVHLRSRTKMLNVRIDSPSGDIVRIDDLRNDLLQTKSVGVAASVIHSALSQLQGLLPGHYLLQHEPSHGTNAMLFAPRITTAKDKQRLTLQFDYSQMAEVDESKTLKIPLITDILLPVHKFRRVLPCAFSPFPFHLAKETKRPVAKQKSPPQAIKWPKKKGRKRKNNRNND